MRGSYRLASRAGERLLVSNLRPGDMDATLCRTSEHAYTLMTSISG
jgi:hypothetical protein